MLYAYIQHTRMATINYTCRTLMFFAAIFMYQWYKLMFIYFTTQVYARTVATEVSHASFGPIKELASQITYLIPDNVQLFGENMFGIHSIEYDQLTSFFYLFGVLENGCDWWSWDHMTELADEIGVPTVPMVTKQQVSGINRENSFS